MARIPTAQRYVLTCGSSLLARLTGAEVLVLQGGTLARIEAGLSTRITVSKIRHSPALYKGDRMEPIHWAIVFLILCTLVSFIASKKGRSGVKLFFAMALPAVPLMLLISYALGDNMEAKPLAMWTVAFLCPVVGFFWALMTENQEQMARAIGEYGDMKKCPFCAESVRKEAIKCKHCGSELPSAA